MSFRWLTGNTAAKPMRPRMTERHDAHGLNCPLGELVDLSTSGMRIRCTARPKAAVGQVIPVTIQNDTQGVRVMAQVVWSRKIGITGSEYQLGCRFMETRPGVIAALDQFARYGCITPGASMNSPAQEGGTSTWSAQHSGAKSQPAPAPSTPAEQPAQPAQPKPLLKLRVDVENIYEHLGLTIDATDDQIRTAYHELAKQYHPDHNSDPAAADRFTVINKTYQVLKDQARRARYDAMLRGA